MAIQRTVYTAWALTLCMCAVVYIGTKLELWFVRQATNHNLSTLQRRPIHQGLAGGEKRRMPRCDAKLAQEQYDAF